MESLAAESLTARAGPRSRPGSMKVAGRAKPDSERTSRDREPSRRFRPESGRPADLTGLRIRWRMEPVTVGIRVGISFPGDPPSLVVEAEVAVAAKRDAVIDIRSAMVLPPMVDVVVFALRDRR